jgi:hypothetical protein
MRGKVLEPMEGERREGDILNKPSPIDMSIPNNLA